MILLFSACFGDVAPRSKPRSAAFLKYRAYEVADSERGWIQTQSCSVFVLVMLLRGVNHVQLHVLLNVVCRVAERGFLHEATSERQFGRERKKQRGREVCVQLLVLFSLFLPLSINLSLSHY